MGGGGITAWRRGRDKGLLVGAGCTYRKDSAWEVMSATIP
jgi:hypothetical protein